MSTTRQTTSQLRSLRRERAGRLPAAGPPRIRIFGDMESTPDVPEGIPPHTEPPATSPEPEPELSAEAAAELPATVECEPGPAGALELSEPPVTRSQLDIAARTLRAKLLEDVEDEVERAEKQALVDKVQDWLRGIGMGGAEPRMFDFTAMVQFAWAEHLQGKSCDYIYKRFVEAQMAAKRQEMARDIGDFLRAPASMLEPMAVRAGWLWADAATAGASGRVDLLVRRWCLLWPVSNLEQTLLLYEGPDAPQPLRVQPLKLGSYEVVALTEATVRGGKPQQLSRNEKQVAQRYPHAFRLKLQRAAAKKKSGGDGGGGSSPRLGSAVLAPDTVAGTSPP
jgi:hypothetical protein